MNEVVVLNRKICFAIIQGTLNTSAHSRLIFLFIWIVHGRYPNNHQMDYTILKNIDKFEIASFLTVLMIL